MNRALVVASLALALLIPGSALAAWPTNSKVNAAVSAVAGKPMNVVCYKTAAEWDARVRVAYRGAYTGDQVRAFTFANSSTVEVGNTLCTTLFYSLRVGPSKVTNLHGLGAVIDVLAHEPQHARGIVSEASAEACATRYFALVIHDLWGTKYHTAAMRLYVSYALAYSATLSPAYQGGTCAR